MKYLKTLGLLAIAAAALMAFSAAASATTLTSPAETKVEVGAKLHGENEKGHVKLANPIANIECSSTVEGEITNAGGPGTSVVGKITTLDFTGCTNSWHVTSLASGTLTLTWKANNEGSLSSSGAKVDTTRLGVTCVYETNNTAIGTATDSTATSATATLHVNASIPINGAESSGLCGTGNASWSGSYILTKPDPLFFDKE